MNRRYAYNPTVCAYVKYVYANMSMYIIKPGVNPGYLKLFWFMRQCVCVFVCVYACMSVCVCVHPQGH